MSKEESNKAVVGRWFIDFWGKSVDLAVVDDIAAPNMLLKYSLHEPRRGRRAPPLFRHSGHSRSAQRPSLNCRRKRLLKAAARWAPLPGRHSISAILVFRCGRTRSVHCGPEC